MNKTKLSEKFGCLIVLMVPILTMALFGIISSIFNDIVAGFTLLFLYIASIMYFSQTITNTEKTRFKKIFTVILWLLILSFILYGVPQILLHFVGGKIVEAYISIIFLLLIVIFVWSSIVSLRSR